MICFDTNAVIAYVKSPVSPLRARFHHEVRSGTSIMLPSIVLFELWYGIDMSQKQQHNTITLKDFLAGPIQVLDFDADDAREAGDIRAALARAGTPIGPYDVLIAAQARRRNALLVTANEREFARVPGLKTEDWAAAP